MGELGFFLHDNRFWLFGLIGGAAIFYGIHFWLDRRAFYRRNEAGVETFSGYRSKVVTGLLEGVVKWIGFFALLITGVCLFVVAFQFFNLN